MKALAFDGESVAPAAFLPPSGLSVTLQSPLDVERESPVNVETVDEKDNHGTIVSISSVSSLAGSALASPLSPLDTSDLMSVGASPSGILKRSNGSSSPSSRVSLFCCDLPKRALFRILEHSFGLPLFPLPPPLSLSLSPPPPSLSLSLSLSLRQSGQCLPIMTSFFFSFVLLYVVAVYLIGSAFFFFFDMSAI